MNPYFLAGIALGVAVMLGYAIGFIHRSRLAVVNVFSRPAVPLCHGVAYHAADGRAVYCRLPATHRGMHAVTLSDLIAADWTRPPF
jgi:hypothetical protein